MLWLEAACGCTTGLCRENNEDNFYFHGLFLPMENTGLDHILSWETPLDRPAYLAVFDGMGGAARGEEAAWLAAGTLARAVESASDRAVSLEEVCLEANRAICRRARERRGGSEGATAVLLRVGETGAELVNIGDSRAFLLRDGVLRQLSVEHTDRAFLRAQGITRRKPRLTQHLGIEPEEMVIEPYRLAFPLCPGDRILLCSDGLSDAVFPEELQAALSAPRSMAETAEQLIRLTMDRGGRDNTTVICAAAHLFGGSGAV